VGVAPAPAAIANNNFNTDSFDLELGRLPALDDASFASDSARDEGPNEFVTDPMRRAVAPEPAPARPAAPAKPVAPRVDASAPAEVNMDALASAPEPAPAPAPAPAPTQQSVTVPVVLTRAQIRSGEPVHLVLDIRVKDE
jgi:hypothetical protein